jgi:hypothetical protein
MPELESVPEKVASVVPYFFYDLYGRIFPGAFLISGLVFAWSSNKLVKDCATHAAGARAAEWVVGSVLGIAACFVAGFLLSEITRHTLWRFKVPLSLGELREHFGSPPDSECSVESAFRECFGFALDHQSKKQTYLLYCGRLCQLAVATRQYALDAVNVRVDAEDLLSRSLCVASAILLVISLVRCQWIVGIVYLTLTVITFASFQHYRDKGLRERFQMFLVLWQTDPTVRRQATSKFE